MNTLEGNSAWQLLEDDTPAQPPTKNARLRQKHLSTGQCIDCKALAADGFQRCAKHREMARLRNAKARALRKAERC